jgi:hypothetical protein
MLDSYMRYDLFLLIEKKKNICICGIEHIPWNFSLIPFFFPPSMQIDVK